MAAETHQGWNDITFTSRDGLRLYARCYPAPMSNRRPVLCLAGLTRNSRDFHDLAMALSTAGDQSRTVYALDARGRGHSEHDPDWRNYTIPIETLDVADFIATYGLQDAAIVGTSRGGLSAMLLAVIQPSALGAVVLNDIGPVVEAEGLVRIIGYVGRTPLPHSWTEAAKLAQSMNRRHFPTVPLETWEEVARAWFNEKNGRPAVGYDEQLSKTISVADGPVPELWPQFGALAHVPLLVDSRRHLRHTQRRDRRRDAPAPPQRRVDHRHRARACTLAQGRLHDRDNRPIPRRSRSGQTGGRPDLRRGLKRRSGARAH